MQRIGNGHRRLVAEIDVQNGQIRWAPFNDRQRSRDIGRGSDDIEASILEIALKRERDNSD